MWSEYALEVVDAVARGGSFSAAAQELHRVPSAISYTVRQLETWLAVPLFERQHREVVLTPAGEHFVREGRSVIKKWMPRAVSASNWPTAGEGKSRLRWTAL